jgi:hypothetical protein
MTDIANKDKIRNRSEWIAFLPEIAIIVEIIATIAAV